ncbi:MAG: efflux RND transporter permease subunit, partial [Planctomycetia bacterium]
MAVLALIVFGFISYRSIGVNMFPNVDIPMVTVTVVNPGVEPETMDQEVAERIEDSVGTISGIKTLRSQSLEGITQVFVEFELDEDVNIKTQEVRDKISLIRQELPREIEEPTVEKLDLDSAPIMSILVSGQKPIMQLTRIADDRVKQEIESIRNVGNVQMVGDRDREIRIWFRADKLRAYSLTAQDVVDAIQRENVEPPGGRIETGQRNIVAKIEGRIQKVSDFEEIIVKQQEQNPIRLGDVAYVEDGMEDCHSIAKLNGQKAICLQVRPQSGTNMVAVAESVKKELDRIRGPLEKDGITLTIAQDNSDFVNQSISEAEGELLRGAGLAVIVIFFFLRSLRGSFVAACTIPATIIGTYAFMYAMGFTVNMMTMLALTISVGMIIDDSIVVLENTYRHMEEGYPRMQAALMAMKEIGFAVIVTSLAIAAVFVPVAFMKGIVGKFFFEFGLTVTAAVVISTTIAVTLSPMLCSRVLKISPFHGRFFNMIESMLRGIERTYSLMLKL